MAVAAEARGAGIGRIRLRTISNASQPRLEMFVQEEEPGSTIHTDGWSGYARLGGSGYNHAVSSIAHSGQRPHELLPRIHLEGWDC